MASQGVTASTVRYVYTFYKIRSNAPDFINTYSGSCFTIFQFFQYRTYVWLLRYDISISTMYGRIGVVSRYMESGLQLPNEGEGEEGDNVLYLYLYIQ